MILHKNRLPADDSHKISCLICYFWKSGKYFDCRLLQIIGGALRVNIYDSTQSEIHALTGISVHSVSELSRDPEQPEKGS